MDFLAKLPKRPIRVELLAKTLPHRRDETESAIVCLDWYAGHRTDEVKEIIESRGHVRLMHGGGTTGMEQVNDTHLHAQFKAKLNKT